MAIILQPIGWCASLAALAAGIFLDRLWVLLGLMAASATGRFWLWQPFAYEPAPSTRGLLDTRNGLKPWVDAATIVAVVLAAFLLADPLSALQHKFHATRQHNRD